MTSDPLFDIGLILEQAEAYLESAQRACSELKTTDLQRSSEPELHSELVEPDVCAEIIENNLIAFEQAVNRVKAIATANRRRD